MHFSEQFFNRSKVEKNFQNIQRAALLVLVVARGLRAVEVVRWHHTRLHGSERGNHSTKESKEAHESPEQPPAKAITQCLQNLLMDQHELYALVKQLVGGICQWVLKRVNKGTKLDDESNASTSMQENSWVKKLQQIIRTQYEGQMTLVQVVDYAQIIQYCQKIQEKFTHTKQSLSVASPAASENGSPDSRTRVNRAVTAANHERLQECIQALSQIVQ